jgi:hypothetical protein
VVLFKGTALNLQKIIQQGIGFGRRGVDIINRIHISVVASSSCHLCFGFFAFGQVGGASTAPKIGKFGGEKVCESY